MYDLLAEIHKIAHELKLIREILQPRLSASLKLKGEGTLPATILVGKTATSQWQEWSGPNGTGDKLPPAGPVTYVSSTPAVATVDPSSGMVTGVAAGTSVITGTDTTNSLTANDTITVTEVATSATLTLVAN